MKMQYIILWLSGKLENNYGIFKIKNISYIAVSLSPILDSSGKISCRATRPLRLLFYF